MAAPSRARAPGKGRPPDARKRGDELVPFALVKSQQAAILFGRTKLFGGLAQEDLERLADRAIERHFKKGQLIFHEGDPGEALYVVAEGHVKVFVTSEDGEAMVLVTLSPSEVFGELAVVDGGPRSASAEALEPTTLLTLTRPTFIEVLGENKRVMDATLSYLGNLLRRLTEQTSDLVFLDLHGRVAKLLLTFGEERGEQNEQGTMLQLGLTQTDIASMVGGSRQSVNQVLRSFERRGYVEISGRQILIKQPDLLRKRAAL